MLREKLFPDYILESSWEVCNKVGGIYTVLSSRARTLQEMLRDRIIFIGPDFWSDDNPCPYFTEDVSLYAQWKAVAKSEGLSVRVGRWNVPGQPVAVLVSYKAYYPIKNDIYTHLWEDFKVDSLHAYGDYDESSMFSYAAGKVVESFYRNVIGEGKRVIYHANEWMTGLGMLYVRKHVPQVGTIFTTHATSIGRSIAGNNKPLYSQLQAYNGDQMARELNMQSKHSIEKQTAMYADCFTTVSDITARECEQLLDKPVDFVLPNGFDNDFVPRGVAFNHKRREARKRMLAIANALTGTQPTLDDDTLIISTSGRYEFRNKGIDVFIEAMHRLDADQRLKKRVLAFIAVPGWAGEARQDLVERLNNNKVYDTPLNNPVVTHWLHDPAHDSVQNMLNYLWMHNDNGSRVKVIFVPRYLTGDDGIVNLPYYDAILGNDLCIYPSYYEPWGYTPLESIAFHVPCITTDLAGFGLWVNSVKGNYSEIDDGVKVIHRTDYNYQEVADQIRDTVIKFSEFTSEQVSQARSNADKLSKKALWRKFIKYYEQAYDMALRKASERK